MTLLELYNSRAIIAPAVGDHDRTFNAKEVGIEPAGATDAINASDHFVGNDAVQKNFKIKQPIKVTQFTGAGLNYIDSKGINTTKYAPSGRL